MFNPDTRFAVNGAVGGVLFTVTVTCEAPEADALPADVQTPLVVDVQNIQVLFVSAINDVLMRLQRMNDAASFESVRAGRNIPSAPEASAERETRKVIPISDYRKSLERAIDGEGD